MSQLKLFLDHWAIVNLLENNSFSAQKARLFEFGKRGFCVLILTIWYVHEALRDKNKERARNLCSDINTLSREVPSLWIRLRTKLQEEEVAEAFCRHIGASHQAESPFCNEAIAIFPDHEKLRDIEVARRDGLLWFFENGQLFSEASAEQKNYPGVKAELKKAVQTLVGAKHLFNESKKEYVRRFLPDTSPGGLFIDGAPKEAFLRQMNLSEFRALYFEALLSQASNKDAQAHPTEEDSVDLQNAVSVVPYVDVAVLDAKFCKYALTVKKQWKNAQPLAECFDNIDAALDWIERQGN